MSDILEPPERVPEKYYVNETILKGLKLNKCHGAALRSPDMKMNTLMAHPHGQAADNLIMVGKFGKGYRGQVLYSADGKACTLMAGKGGADAKTGLYAVQDISRKHLGQHGAGIKPAIGKSYTLTTLGHTGMTDGVRIRRLMPIECERLQGFRDGWTAEGELGPISDTARYRMMGNAVTVPVVEYLARLLEVVP